MRVVAPWSCLLLLLVADRAPAQPTPRSPFASWAADVASPARAAAAPWLGRELLDDGSGRSDRSRTLRATLDRSGPLVGADVAVALGATGRGSLIAIVDSGVDFSHPAFLDAAGRPRIVWYLDLTLPSRGAAVLDDRGGALFDRDELARALRDPAAPRPTPDVAGHGTRVASIAAGDEPPYRGVAPGAELLVVRADRLPGGRYDEADVADAVDFAFDAAAALGRPCVVNLSLGGQAGAHDGTSWLERTIDRAVNTGPGGRAVVVAAGNDGEAAVHARLEASGASSGRVTLVVPGNGPLPGAPAAVVLLDLWSSPGRTFGVTVALPDGSLHSVAPGAAPLELVLPGAASLRLEPPSSSVPAARSTEGLLALVGGDDGAIPPGRYTVTVRDDAPVDAWLAVEARTSFLPFRLEGDLVAETSLALPATARGAIAVGSLVSRTAWTNHLGAWVESTAGAWGRPSAFSALGPTADGRFKPDLGAPGEWILGAQSADADWPLAPGGLPATATDARWSAGRGTSLAAPHVAGAVALLFEREPGLHAPEVVERLRAAARGTGRWDPAGGFGRLDVPALLAPLPPPPATARLALSLARPRLPRLGPRATELALLRRAGTAPVDGSGCSVRWPAKLDVTSACDGATCTALVDASRLAPGECVELVALDDGVPAGSCSLCVAATPASGCGVASPPPVGRSSMLGPWCLLAAAVGWRFARRRRWPFLLASVAAHLVLLGLLAWWLPALRPPAPAPLVAAGIVAELERRALPPPPSTAAPRTTTPPETTPPNEPARPDEPAVAPVAVPDRPARPRRTAAAAAATAAGAAAGTSAELPVPDSATLAGEAGDLSLPPQPGLPGPSTATVGVPPAAEPDVPRTPPAAADPCAAAAGALRAVVDLHKRYPPLARRRGLSGTTVVAFELATDGALTRLAVERSSGSALLDEAALAAIRDAAPFAVGGCSFTLPLQFRLAEPTAP